MSPMQLGPKKRIPVSRAISTISACTGPALLAGSAKPAVAMTTQPTPAAAQSRHGFAEALRRAPPTAPRRPVRVHP